MTPSTEGLTGGCQCGHVRFRVTGELRDASICHCRMCQKAFGNFFAPLVTVEHVTWTKAEPKRFQSSNVVKRGFCPDCGTPLTFESPNGVGLAIGAFDDPSAVPPIKQDGIEGKIAYVDHLADLPGERTEEAPPGSFIHSVISYQHPDHDT
jgi:hypothetical protein